MSMLDEEYECHVVHEITLANTTAVEAYDCFVRFIWWGGGGFGKAGVIREGNSTTLEDSVRSVPLGIHEAVLKVVYPSSIEYTLIQKSIFPVSAHHGKISFNVVEGEQKSLNVVWSVRYTPYRCMNWLVRVMLLCLDMQLQALKMEIENEKCSKEKSI